MKLGFFEQLGIIPIDFDHIFISFLPNKDKQGNKIDKKDLRRWETDVLKLQGRFFGGATSYPPFPLPSRGSYKTSTGRVLVEETKAIVSYVQEEELTKEALKAISDFLKKFGKKTNQETVAFALDNQMYYIEIK